MDTTLKNSHCSNASILTKTSKTHWKKALHIYKISSVTTHVPYKAKEYTEFSTVYFNIKHIGQETVDLKNPNISLISVL